MEQNNMVVEENEQEDDEHRKSRHILNLFVGKVDDLQEYKMLGCDDCNVSFDRTAMVLVPKNSEALKYIAHETTGHMASLFNKCESLLFDQLVQNDKNSLSCWPFELVQFAATSIAHAFHAPHVICGAVDTTFQNQSEFIMQLDKSGIVLVIGCHEHHYALLEADPKKRKVIIWESTKFEMTSSAAAFWMECITIILWRHWPDELEDDYSNVLPLGMKIKKNAKKKNKKKIWWVQYNVGYLQEGEDECGAVAFNQLAWRLNALTESQHPKDLCAFIKDPHKLKAGNRENAYQIVCHLIKTQRKEKIWLKMEGDNDESEQLQERKDDSEVGNVICKKTEEGKNDVGGDDPLTNTEEGEKNVEQGEGQQPAAKRYREEEEQKEDSSQPKSLAS
jgi:plasmid maintenance system killer protein